MCSMSSTGYGHGCNHGNARGVVKLLVRISIEGTVRVIWNPSRVESAFVFSPGESMSL